MALEQTFRNLHFDYHAIFIAVSAPVHQSHADD